jgi:delta 1-pyrroline-5-carboxylate dehydrogenase
MHQDVEPSRDIVRITDDTTKAEIEQALTNHVATLHRWPTHWTSQRDRMHARIDALLDDWRKAPDPRTLDAQAG